MCIVEGGVGSEYGYEINHLHENSLHLTHRAEIDPGRAIFVFGSILSQSAFLVLHIKHRWKTSFREIVAQIEGKVCKIGYHQ